MEKVINGSKLQIALADYLATNAYINDTAQDVLVMVAKWIDEAPEVNAWIPVTERLPGFCTERVLVVMDRDMILGYPKMDTDRCVDGRWVRYGDCVTHWMPLPELPKEVE